MDAVIHSVTPTPLKRSLIKGLLKNRLQPLRVGDVMVTSEVCSRADLRKIFDSKSSRSRSSEKHSRRRWNCCTAAFKSADWSSDIMTSHLTGRDPNRPSESKDLVYQITARHRGNREVARWTDPVRVLRDKGKKTHGQRSRAKNRPKTESVLARRREKRAVQLEGRRRSEAAGWKNQLEVEQSTDSDSDDPWKASPEEIKAAAREAAFLKKWADHAQSRRHPVASRSRVGISSSRKAPTPGRWQESEAESVNRTPLKRRGAFRGRRPR